MAAEGAAMDLRTRYLGFELAHPLVVGASPLADDLDLVRRLEDAGAAAIVLRSLFEEQLAPAAGSGALVVDAERGFADGLSYLPRADQYALGRDEYLEQLRRVKRAVGVPVVASLNGTTLGGWLAHARLLEEAGADALELNLYKMVADPLADPRAIEDEEVELVTAVADAVLVPVAVKLSPYYTSIANFAQRLDRAGAAGLVLFNRFYQADVDLEALEVRPRLHLSSPRELLLRLRWLAALAGRVRASLAATGGVHSAEDVVKAVLCGADAVQIVSLLLRHGPERLASLRHELALWLERHECDALSDLNGALSLERCPDPAAFERAQYLWLLQGARARPAGDGESP
jgi:dihydroorotate dehydrogenase (fumarate)